MPNLLKQKSFIKHFKASVFKKSARDFEAYTLIEIVIVLALTLFLLTATMQSVFGTTQQFAFNNAYGQIDTLVRTARSLAVTGKAQLDYVNYDLDGCDANGPTDLIVPPETCPAGGDYVTPANYGVYFEHHVLADPATPDRVVLFADMHTKPGGAVTTSNCKENQFDDPAIASNSTADGCDIVLDSFAVAPSNILLNGFTRANGCGGDLLCATIFYSPIFADFSAKPALDIKTNAFFIFGVSQIVGTLNRTHCEKIHVFAGIPEPFEATEDANDPTQKDCLLK